jgi:propane monooxygenase reductase subunit
VSGHTVRLAPFGVEFECEESESVLNAALRAGISLRYGCKHGGCGSCKVQLIEGEVDHAGDSASAISEAERDAGIALLCCAHPLEDIVVELADDYTEQELQPRFPIREFAATLQAVDFVTHDTAHLALLLSGERIAFGPGQFIEIAAPGSEQFRAYSMANSPSADDRVELLTKLLPGGVFSTYLRERAVAGDRLPLRGPFGQFQIAETVAPIVMVAGGSGMAPIYSMLTDLREQGSTREIVFYYGARSARDLYWLDRFAALERELASFRFVPALSEPLPEDGWQGQTGLITEVIARNSNSLRGAEGYLCGPPGMIDAAVAVLKSKGMFTSRIRFDKFLSTAG